MSSQIKADLIKDKSGTKTLATLSSSAVTLDSSVVFPAGGTGNPISVAYLYDEKSNGTVGGGASSGYQTRHLNTKSDPDGFVSLNTSTFKFTLGAGTYLIHWSAPAYQSYSHQSALYNDTASSHLISGTSEYADQDNAVANRSFGYYNHTITSDTTYYIRHFFQSAKTTNGLGVSSSSGNSEIYTYVIIYKLK